ncbi:MAG: tetratricopeptide repeat protein [Treponema sp.]|nr:tetratricopeptide repeat protein [Treponema sp.]
MEALRNFKASFDKIGNEQAVLAEQDIPYEELPLPEVEAEIPDTSAEEAAEAAAAMENLSQMGLDPSVAAALGIPETGPEEGADTALGDFDLGALLGSVPGDLPGLPDEIPGQADIPEGLLDGLAEDLEQSPPDNGDAETGGLEIGDLGDLSGFGDLDAAGLEDAGPDLEDAETGGLEIGDLGDLGDFGDLDAAGLGDAGLDLEDAETGEPGDPEALSLDLGGENAAGDLDLGGEAGELNGSAAASAGPETQDAAPEADDAEWLNLDLGEGFGETDLAGGGTDSFDNFDLEEPPPAPSQDEEAAGDLDLGDFTLPGIDDMLGGIPDQKPGKTRKSIFGAPKEEEDEDISLDETDLTTLRRTLAAYPLNLRLAVEEIIAEQAVPPEQMGNLIRLLVRGALPRETAALAGKILGKTISIPRGFQKKTGEQLEAEQGSAVYIFVHRFLPVFRLFLFIALVAASASYLAWRFIYNPVRAENFYRLGYERIAAGEYERANQRFTQAFNIHRDKEWFYRYAEAFRDQRQYLYARNKYDELLSYYPRDKRGVLAYAAMETYYEGNYEKADLLLRHNILDYEVNDPDALLAQGDNALAWGEIDPSRYETARFAYARLLDRYGWTDPVAERMLRYFIRTDNLKEVIPLQSFFMDNPKKKISAETLAELGGYLLDKRTEEVRGVPNAYVEQIAGVRDVLLRAIMQGPGLPEAHYHLSRYYRNLGSWREEQLTLEVALKAFDSASEESLRRLIYHIEALDRHAAILIGRRENFPAEEQLVKAIGLYENALERKLLSSGPRFGRLYAAMGDLEYFTKSGDMETALGYYRKAEENAYAPPEMLYRMGSAHYHRQEWAPALERFFASSARLPLNRRLLQALGNACYQRGDYHAAQGYYNRLLDLLEAERARLPILLPNDRPEYIDLAQRLMIAQNNLGVTLEALSQREGSPRYRSQAASCYIQSAQAWDALTRNPLTMIRLGAGDLSSPGINLAFLNSRNILYPQTGYEPQIFIQIDKDVLDPSPWETD